MTMTRRGLGAAALAAGVLPLAARAQAPAAPAAGPEIKPLGEDRFQIDRLVVDRRTRRITVPGKVHAAGKPLEYLAGTAKGVKAYETLFDLEVMPTAFKLACILIGLERDPRAAEVNRNLRDVRFGGSRVEIWIAWGEGAQRKRVPAAEALLNPESGIAPAQVEWVYTGSPATERPEGLPLDQVGMLIGFIHDPHTVIEAASALGLGAYGSIRGHAMLPPNGTAIELVVEAAPAR